MNPNGVEDEPATGRLPELHLTVGLPGAGKTTVARQIAEATGALRLTPDEWMSPLFGHHDAEGKRQVLEGRLLWVAAAVLAAGGSVILDFGCWSRVERLAIRSLAEEHQASFLLHVLPSTPQVRRIRTQDRAATEPGAFTITEAEHVRYEAAFEAPTADETESALPPPPAGYGSWAGWRAQWWPTSGAG